MRWYRKLYITDSLKKKKYKIVWRIKNHKPLLHVYVLMFPINPKNEIEIIHANYLLQPYYKKKDVRIIGITDSHDEAMELLVKIVQEVYNNTGTANVKEYIVNQQNKNYKRKNPKSFSRVFNSEEKKLWRV